jgi:hypothetical protein
MTDEPQPRPWSGALGRAWADLPLRAKGLVVVAIPLLALLLASVLFGVALVQAGVTGYVHVRPTGRRAPGSASSTATRRPPTPWSPSWRPWPTPSSACSPAVAAVLLFTSGVTRRAAQLEGNAAGRGHGRQPRPGQHPPAGQHLLGRAAAGRGPVQRDERTGKTEAPAAEEPAAQARIPVVILSADARPGLIQRLLEEGARGFLTKPLDVRELLEVLDGVAADREQAGRA